MAHLIVYIRLDACLGGKKIQQMETIALIGERHAQKELLARLLGTLVVDELLTENGWWQRFQVMLGTHMLVEIRSVCDNADEMRSGNRDPIFSQCKAVAMVYSTDASEYDDVYRKVNRVANEFDALQRGDAALVLIGSGGQRYDAGVEELVQWAHSHGVYCVELTGESTASDVRDVLSKVRDNGRPTKTAFKSGGGRASAPLLVQASEYDGPRRCCCSIQ
jgi:gamma-glutamyl:cysteine ligase YbdK (ATP-grasp superfamily)